MSSHEQPALIQDLKTLVDFPTTSIPIEVLDPTEAQVRPFTDAVDYLKERVAEIGETRGKPFHIAEYERNGRPNLVVGTHDTLEPDVAFLIHLDVVAPHFPFELSDDGTIAKGRGVNDMKFAAAAALVNLAELPADDAISVSYMFTSDEEVGARDGAQLLHEKGYRPKFMVVPDGDSNNPWSISETCKGLWHFRIENIPGQNGHASRPWLGENAVRKAMELDAKLHAEYPDPADDTQAFTASTLNLADVGVPRDIDVKHNQIPGEAFLMYDGRFHSQEAMDDFTTRVNELVETDVPGAVITTQVRYPFYQADLSHPDVVLFRQAMEEVSGQPTRPIKSPSNTDAAHFRETPTLITAIEGGGAHAADEWISIDGMVKFIDMTRRFLDAKRQASAQ